MLFCNKSAFDDEFKVRRQTDVGMQINLLLFNICLHYICAFHCLHISDTVTVIVP